MVSYRRGDVWWAELAGDAGFRPVVLLTRTDQLERRRNVTVAEITRVVRRVPAEVPLSPVDGLPTACVINTDNIHTIPLDRLRERISSLSDERLFELARALHYSLELDW